MIGSRFTIPRTNIETALPADVISVSDVKNLAQTVTQILNYIAPSLSYNRQKTADGQQNIKFPLFKVNQ